MIVIVPRLLAGLCGPTGAPPLGRQWQDTCISLPGSAQRDLAFLNELTGARLQPHNPLSVAQALADFPVAVLVQGEGSGHSHGAGG
jgi:maltooligosyltrehalose synthase